MATFVEFLSNLNHCKQQAIFWHNQTNSYSAHGGALEGFYEEIEDLLDGLAESVAGIYGRPVGYTSNDFEDYTDVEQVLAYFKSVYDYVQTERKSLYQESWIQNDIDSIAKLLALTLYKLTLK